MDAPLPALDAIRAWVRLDMAFGGFNRHLKARYGVTGIQLAMLRIIAEREPISLAELRANLVLHPATLGQLVDRLGAAGLVSRATSAADRRRREVRLSPTGRRLLRRAPVGGPVRLRTAGAPAARLKALAEAFTDAIELFGLQEWERNDRGAGNRQRAPRGRRPGGSKEVLRGKAGARAQVRGR